MGMESLGKQNKGVALLWTLIICLVLLIVSGTMVGYIIKDSQATVRIEDSVQAYAAAKSGMDWGIWYVNKAKKDPYSAYDCDGDGINGSRLAIDNMEQTIDLTKSPGPNVTATVYIDGSFCVEDGYDNSSDRFVIKSNGEVNSVQRELQYEIKISEILSAINDQPINGNFKLTYDFWLENSTSEFDFGIADTSGGYAVAVEVKDNKACLKTGNAPVTDYNNDCIALTSSDQDYRFRANIKYAKGVMAVLEITERNADLTLNSDNLSISVPAFGGNIHPKSTFYFSPKGTMVDDVLDYYLVSDLSNNPLGYIYNTSLYQ